MMLMRRGLAVKLMEKVKNVNCRYDDAISCYLLHKYR